MPLHRWHRPDRRPYGRPVKGQDWPVLGYADRFSVAPGGKLRVMVSTELREVTATVVRLGGATPKAVEVHGAGAFRGRQQPIHTGSYVRVPHDDRLDRLTAITLQAWIYPTSPGDGRRQGIVANRTNLGGWALDIDEAGRLAFTLQSEGGGPLELKAAAPVRWRNWYFVSCSCNGASGITRLSQQALQPWPEPEIITQATLHPTRGFRNAG